MSDHNEGETHPTVQRMERVAKGLFRDAGIPQPDIEPEKVNWKERIKRVFRKRERR